MPFALNWMMKNPLISSFQFEAFSLTHLNFQMTLALMAQ